MATSHQIYFTIPTQLGLKVAVTHFYDTVLTHPGATSFAFLILAFFPKLPPRLIGTVLLLPLVVFVLSFALAVLAVRCCFGAFGGEGASSGGALASSHDDGEAITASSTLSGDQHYGATDGSPSRDVSPPDHHRDQESILWFHMRLIYAGLALYFYCLSISLDAYRCDPSSEVCTFVKG
ncbi:hypothetical protein EST38_g13087 [Candolleomyces aberdarensis]|uniref:Uncharacterized protein n=1 Tax=Candolleomyces aberdarensis TaxID=2316362 RepID=A0A4Q2D0S7_9AGAR|nr:hypothetical protein EST38_g13087 [Candolleomyces aberdarensis]